MSFDNRNTSPAIQLDKDKVHVSLWGFIYVGLLYGKPGSTQTHSSLCRYVQGTAGRQNYSLIGDSLNYTFLPAKILSDMIVQNQIGTSDGGPNWIEYLSGCFEGLPNDCIDLRKDKRALWDFAFAGAVRYDQGQHVVQRNEMLDALSCGLGHLRRLRSVAP